jgi:hypothetical protein
MLSQGVTTSAFTSGALDRLPRKEKIMKIVRRSILLAIASLIAGVSIGLIQFDLSKLVEPVRWRGTAISQPARHHGMEAEKHSEKEPEISKHDVWQ